MYYRKSFRTLLIKVTSINGSRMLLILVFRDTSNSAILPQGYRTGHGQLAGMALHPTMSQSLCLSRRWGRGEATQERTAIGAAKMSRCAPQESDQSFYGFLIGFFTVIECVLWCFLVFCEIGRLLEPKSEIGQSFGPNEVV